MPRCYICDNNNENLPNTYLTNGEKSASINYTEDGLPICRLCEESIKHDLDEEFIDDEYRPGEITLSEPSVDSEDQGES